MVVIWRKFKCLVFSVLPMHWVSRLAFALSRIDSPIQHWVIRRYMSYWDIDLSEARTQNVPDYPDFDTFFTRLLRPDARPVCSGAHEVSSPCDGVVLQSGAIDDSRLIQAKGHYYDVRELLTPELGKYFKNGKFITIYLSPRDYHRVHMPLSGKLEKMVYVPGRLVTVAPYAAEVVPRLYARNERVVSCFSSQFGKMAVAMIGGVNVAAIETSWHGLVSPADRALGNFSYTRSDADIVLNKGDEMGIFHIGSTVILLFQNDKVKWHSSRATVGSDLKFGQAIATFPGQQSAASKKD